MISTSFDIITQVAWSMHETKNKPKKGHSYLKLQNDKLVTTPIKTSATSLREIALFVEKTKGMFTSQNEKNLALSSWLEIKRGTQENITL